MNNRTKRLAAATAIFAVLSGCVTHTWAPGPQVAGDFGRVSGQCKLQAMASSGGGGGFFWAYGRPRFVAAAMAGHLLGSAIRSIGSAVGQQNVYNACMESAGFVAVE
jgi:hypothetical protein